MIPERIAEMLGTCSGNETLFPPTVPYNEGWMLRLALDWFATTGDVLEQHPLPDACIIRQAQ